MCSIPVFTMTSRGAVLPALCRCSSARMRCRKHGGRLRALPTRGAHSSEALGWDNLAHTRSVDPRKADKRTTCFWLNRPTPSHAQTVLANLRWLAVAGKPASRSCKRRPLPGHTTMQSAVRTQTSTRQQVACGCRTALWRAVGAWRLGPCMGCQERFAHAPHRPAAAAALSARHKVATHCLNRVCVPRARSTRATPC